MGQDDHLAFFQTTILPRARVSWTAIFGYKLEVYTTRYPKNGAHRLVAGGWYLFWVSGGRIYGRRHRVVS